MSEILGQHTRLARERTAFAFICALLIVSPVRASDLLVMPMHGFSVSSKNGSSGKSFRFAIDKREFLDSFDYWKDEQVLRRDTTETIFRSHPYTFASLFALSSVVPLLHGKTAKFNWSPTKIVGEIVEADEYGYLVSHQMFSFTFTKSMDAKINWDGFDAKSFQTIAPDFHYTSWFEHKLHSEPSWGN